MTQIDFSLLPAPDVIEQIDFETILATMKVDLLVRDPTLTAVNLESEPLAKCLDPCDHLPRRSYPLFLAREVLLEIAGGATGVCPTGGARPEWA